MTQLLAQRERVFFRDPDDRGGLVFVPVLATDHLVVGPDGVEVRFKLRDGGSVSVGGRLLASWVLGRQDCPVTFADEPGDLVLGEVTSRGRLGVRLFTPDGRGVLVQLSLSSRGISAASSAGSGSGTPSG